MLFFRRECDRSSEEGETLHHAGCGQRVPSCRHVLPHWVRIPVVTECREVLFPFSLRDKDININLVVFQGMSGCVLVSETSQENRQVNWAADGDVLRSSVLEVCDRLK